MVKTANRPRRLHSTKAKPVTRANTRQPKKKKANADTKRKRRSASSSSSISEKASPPVKYREVARDPSPKPSTSAGLSKEWYTVNKEMLDFVLGVTSVPPVDVERTFGVWWNDEWNHLHTPHPDLQGNHFLRCAPPNTSNSETMLKYMNACNNLSIASARMGSHPDQKGKKKQVLSQPIPYPSLVARSSISKPGIDYGHVVRQLDKITGHVVEGTDLLVRTVNKFTAVAESAPRDTSQTMKAEISSSLNRVNIITTQATAAARPITSGGTTSASSSIAAAKPLPSSGIIATTANKPRRRPIVVLDESTAA